MSNVNKFFEGLTVGGLLGFFCGLLAAPKPGAELRKDLLNESEELCKQATESVTDIKTKANQAISTLQMKGEELARTASETLSGKKTDGDHKTALAKHSDSASTENLPPHLN